MTAEHTLGVVVQNHLLLCLPSYSLSCEKPDFFKILILIFLLWGCFFFKFQLGLRVFLYPVPFPLPKRNKPTNPLKTAFWNWGGGGGGGGGCESELH